MLRQAVQSTQAKSGAAVVLDSRTGEVLALADYPTFDPNKPGKVGEGLLNSKALGDVYEPGSVEKVLTASALHRRRQGHPDDEDQGARSSCRCSTGSSATGSTTA